jgi:MYXO-CTERM domain-containing protein
VAVLLPLLALLAVAGSAGSAAAQSVTFVSSSFNSGSLQAAWSHTVPAGGQDRYLLVGVSLRHVQRATVVTEARFVDAMNVTQPLTMIGSATFTGQARVELWGLAAPGEGEGVITVRLDASGGLVAGALSFNGVHQTTPAGPVVSNMGMSDSASVVVPSAPGEAIVSVFAGNGNVLPVAGAPHVGRWSFQGLLLGTGGSEPGRAGATVFWDSPGASQPWLLAGLSLKPAQVVAPPPDAAPDLAPDVMPPPADVAVLDTTPPPVDTAPPPADTGPPPADTAATDGPGGGTLDSSPSPADTSVVDSTPIDAGPGPDDRPDTGAVPADGGGGGTDAGSTGDGGAGASDGGDARVDVHGRAYDIGCACRFGAPAAGPSAGPLAALALLALLALVRRRRR